MIFEKAAGAVIFRKEKDKIYYLLLHYPSSVKAMKDYWGFCKGHIEKEEQELKTAKREIQEETGIKSMKFIKGFKEQMKYFFKFEKKSIFKIVSFYLVETKTKEISISFEHIGYKWLSYKEALKQLTFENAKQLLKKANSFIQKDMVK
ncbi:NUDIX domain-containing protein [Candidatus Parcubacteria bacterium]|nr:NUDIX domain-containing protein [Candidatus Parcubacteria bacterium]